MNRNQGLVFGSVVVLGMLLRPFGSSGPQPGHAVDNLPAATSRTGSANRRAANEGPWIASCHYWAPGRGEASAEPGPPLNPQDVPVEITAANIRIDLNSKSPDDLAEPGCGDDTEKDPSAKWGFPKTNHRLDVTAIIATVPDPVHSHLSLAFDRTVDAILQAASDNGYVSSYYWLPWRRPGLEPRSSDSSSTKEPGHDPERERQPGLIILKNIPDAENATPENGYDRVIYLFLVAETPTEGIVGSQFANAIQYESELKNAIETHDQPKSTGAPHDKFSRGGNDNAVSIIGPMYSGSAASLRAAIDATQNSDFSPMGLRFSVMGATGTLLSAKQLNWAGKIDDVDYYSFVSDISFAEDRLIEGLTRSSLDCSRIGELVEDNTALGSELGFRSREYKLPDGTTAWESLPSPTTVKPEVDACKRRIQTFRFPREISLLRNAKAEIDRSMSSPDSTGSVPSPYLPFSVKDSSAQDAVSQFSREITPLSQEAQLMAIARQLHKARIEFIIVTASNKLDQIFLAQFLHRACPDARLVFFESDRLMVRDVDDVPFIGSVTVSPYSFIGMSAHSSEAFRAYTDTSSEALYIASYFAFFQTEQMKHNAPVPSVYMGMGRTDTGIKAADQADYPALWMTVIGSDGYYPLGVLDPCASDRPEFLPPVDPFGNIRHSTCQIELAGKLFPAQTKGLRILICPARSWTVLCIVICLLCLGHGLMLLVADVWSPFTRDLAIRDSDQPRRRSMYIHVSTAMLFSMAFIVSFPALAIEATAEIAPEGYIVSVLTLLCGAFAVIAAFAMSFRYLRVSRHIPRSNFYLAIDGLAWITLILLPGCWAQLCLQNNNNGTAPFYVGLSFAYRNLYPGSGVSPSIPLLLLLFSWYVWGFFQTWRLRFSEDGRPCLPEPLDPNVPNPYYVSDQDLQICDSPRRPCLYKNVTCVLITRQVLRRFFTKPTRRLLRARARLNEPDLVNDAAARDKAVEGLKAAEKANDEKRFIDVWLVAIFVLVFSYLALHSPFRAIDHFLWHTRWKILTIYEILIAALFFPLLWMAVAGWLRLIMVWGSLKRGLLEKLENQPIRFAFSRLEGMGWMTILREGGLHGHSRDEARCIESIRQLLHMEPVKDSLRPDEKERLLDAYDRVERANRAAQRGMLARPGARISGQNDHEDTAEPYKLMNEVELALAEFSRRLLDILLIPYWRDKRTGLVESRETDELPIRAKRSQIHAEQPRIPMELHAGPASSDPDVILAAEECIAIRYMSLIRAVLANMRYLMTFVSSTFVFAIVAWNSYPFQPRQYVDWVFTALLVFLGVGVIWVFAQMHRNPILSRVTDTKANELGWDFYLRIIAFGAIPVLTWLAYQFPDIGSAIYRFLQPGTSVLK